MRVEVGGVYEWVGGGAAGEQWKILEELNPHGVKALLVKSVGRRGVEVGNVYGVIADSPWWQPIDDFKYWAQKVRKEAGVEK